MTDHYALITELAKRALAKNLGGEGSQESRVAALLLSAVDQIATAAQIDSSLFQLSQKITDEVRLHLEGQSVDRGGLKWRGDGKGGDGQKPWVDGKKMKQSSKPSQEDDGEEKEDDLTEEEDNARVNHS